ncbi:MAG TPA: CHAT domain-containing tetratricopeptide repeat protein [Blastocatellia bacterium]|nr:CHAT domain-containing tetratricopeptide repeat protein [Blastocatellia bacterium]
MLCLCCGLSALGAWPQAFGRAHDPIHQINQQSRGTNEVTGDGQDVRTLEPGRSIRRELTAGQQHTYQIRLKAGQFLKVIVDQNGVDLSVQVSSPAGDRNWQFDSERRLRGPEAVSLVAETEGDYRLQVQSTQKGAAAGSYELRVEQLRAATDDDRALDEARAQYEESDKLQRAGKYDDAIRSVGRVIATRQRVLGPDHREVALATRSLANLYYYQGNYRQADELLQQARSTMEKALGPDHPDVALVFDSLTALYSDKGDSKSAEGFALRSLEIRERALEPEHLDVAQSLNALADIYREGGDYAKAETLYQRALKIKEQALGPDHLSVAGSLNNLAILYLRRGDYVKAESHYRQVLQITEQKLGPDHLNLSRPLNSLAILYHKKGEYAKAEPFYQRALSLIEKTLGPEHPTFAGYLGNLAILYRDRGDYQRAEELYRRSLAIREKKLEPDHHLIADSLNNLANLHRDRREYAKAAPLYQRSLAILEKSLGTEHLDYAETLDNQAVLEIATGNPSRAVALQSQASAIIERNLALNLSSGSERQKLAYLDTFSKQFDRILSLHARYAPEDPKARDLAVTLILQRKGRALDATSENLNALRSRFEPQDRALLDRLTEARLQLARFVLDGPQGASTEQYQNRIKSFEELAEKLEAEIGHKSSEFRAQALPLTLEAVRAAIPAGAALIEFATYRPFDATAATDEEAYGPPHYVAYVVRRRGEVQWKELGEAKIIDQALVSLREAQRDPQRKDVKSLARVVFRKLFQPLRPLIADAEQLLISPEGSLNLIPFAALVDKRGRYLIERYSIGYLTSGRDLLRLQVARDSQSGPLVMAAPDFGGRPRPQTIRLSKRRTTGPIFRQFYFTALPYTAEEGEALRALLPDATLLTRRRANKAALLQVRGPELLHIATHGFFLKSLDAGSRPAADNNSRLLKQLQRLGIRVESPLLRSGLALAGANEDQAEDNGILTALEVTGLNLWGTKLVVLSACDTGVGEVRNGDGVHGLRRALVLAGSETQVMSLWAVSDEATRDLMVDYYGGLKQGQGRGEALRRVQLQMLKNPKRRHPYYWASFIQSGEWAPLGKKI